MTIITGPKPGTTVPLVYNKWVTVAVGKVPAGDEMHGMLYANVSGKSKLTPGMGVQVDIRALRNGYGDDHPDFDATCYDGRAGVVQPGGSWHTLISQTWFGHRPGDTMHFQLKLLAGGYDVTVKGTRYPKMMTN